MRYYVIARDDGRKFGPADLATLSQWALEGRVMRDTMLEAELTGERLQASNVVGIEFPPDAAPPPPTDWSRPPEFGVGNPPPGTSAPGTNDLTLAWVFSVLSIALCFAYGCLAVVLGPFALHFAKKAEAQGLNATWPKVVAYIAMALGAIYVVGMAALILIAVTTG